MIIIINYVIQKHDNCIIIVSFILLDFNECARASDNNCDTNAVCTNTPGNFTCVCNDGYIGNGLTCMGKQPCMDTQHTCALTQSASLHAEAPTPHFPTPVLVISITSCIYSATIQFPPAAGPWFWFQESSSVQLISKL